VNFTKLELLDHGRRHAEGVLIGKAGAQLLPTFHIQFKDRPPVIMATPWSNDREKALTFRAVRAALKTVRPFVENYSFMTEAWIAVQNHRPRETDLMPSEREDRKECVIITFGDHDGCTMRAFEIMRGPDARVTALKPEKEAGACDRFEGRAINLMADDE
jgi:hypothetical protein